MEYKVIKSSLQDVQTRTVDLYATAQELGEISAGNLEINADDIQDGLATADIFLAYNHTAVEVMTASITSGVLTLDGSTAVTATDKIHLVVRLP